MPVYTLDQLKRPLQDLRISVTDRCNFRCQYCMPAHIFGPDFPFLSKREILSFEEIARLATIFVELGVKKLRITGGEPLLRKNINQLIKELNTISGVEDIGLTTNGVLLTKHAKSLYEAGLRRINISLDGMNDAVFKKINGRGVSSSLVLEGIETAIHTGFHVKVNMVVQKGVNEDELLPMADYFRRRGVTLRFIEYMDVGNSNRWDWAQVVTKKEILKKLSERYKLKAVAPAYDGEVAKRYRYVGQEAEVGFITSVSESFCSNCTRARISAEGKLYTCLFASDGVDLRTKLRAGVSDKQLKAFIKRIWQHRNDRYSDERTAGKIKRKKIEMSYIGG